MLTAHRMPAAAPRQIRQSHRAHVELDTLPQILIDLAAEKRRNFVGLLRDDSSPTPPNRVAPPPAPPRSARSSAAAQNSNMKISPLIQISLDEQ